MQENTENILTEVKSCQKCKTIIGYKKFPITSHGKTDSEFMLVSEAPGKKSIDTENKSEIKYWMGAGGKILRLCFTDTDKNLEDIFYLTDIVKCWPNEKNENRTPNETEILNCSSFLKREIESLKPKLILSFGKKSSEYLLNKEINLKKSHGKIYDFNNNTKILVMYHPSGIDRFMKRETYTTQLKVLFVRIIDNNIENIETIFDKPMSNDSVKVKEDERKSSSVNNISNHFKGISFTLPAPGNEITQSDISQNQLRITADFKNHFPNKNADLKFTYKKTEYSVKFNNRGKRSHILKLGSKLMNQLNLTPLDNVRITKVNSSEFSIEKIGKS